MQMVENMEENILCLLFTGKIMHIIHDQDIHRLVEIHKIIDIVLAGVYKRLETLGYHIELTVEAKDFLAEKGYDPQFGARPLHRAIQKHVEDPLAEEILNTNIAEGDLITVDLDESKEKLKFEIKKKPKAKKAKEEQN